jgi:hypothetical protein
MKSIRLLILSFFLIISSIESFSQKFAQKFIEQERNKWVETVNNGFKKFAKGDARNVWFVRSKDNDFIIYFQGEIDVEYATVIEYGFENNYIEKICYEATNFILEDELVRDYYILLKYQYILFNIEINYNYSKTVKYFRRIRADDLVQLEIPFTKSELYNILSEY